MTIHCFFRFNVGNVGIGTASPNSSKGSSGYLDARDVYLRDVARWASQGMTLGQNNCVWRDAEDVCSDGWDTIVCNVGEYMAGVRTYTGDGRCGRVTTVSARCCTP